ncbi:MAG: hypothetical protein QUT30_08190 [Acidobacteriota bacterium]|jgi:hypothetical protein|nr:hypothetical protein [Acidobacteriota bacterium]
MAVTALTSTALTLMDWAKRLDPNGKVPVIVELLSQTNEILKDMVWKPGNMTAGERVTVRTGLPTVYWRMINQHVAASKSRTAQVDFGTGMLEAWSKVDEDLVKLGGNENETRLSEAMAFIEAMNQEMAGTVFYGNQGTAPEEFTGLAPMYSAISGAANAQNVISAGGSGSDNYSIWLVVWSPQTVYGIFPQGSKAGIQHKNWGLQIDTDSNGDMSVYKDQWKWKAGLVVKDWRYVVRICNIDVSNLIGVTSAADLTDYMIKALYRVPSLKIGKPAFYMNRTCAQMLDILRRNDVIAGGGLNYTNVDGKQQMDFRGIPIRICDQLVTETTAIS